MLSGQDHHRIVRKAIMPSLGRRAAEAHTTVMAEMARREIESWPLNTPFPVQPRLRNLALGMILIRIFGHDEDFIRLLHSRLSQMLAITPTLMLLQPRLRRLPRWRDKWARFLRIHGEVDELILRRITSRPHVDNADDMLSHLLATRTPNGCSPTAVELRDNIMTMAIAGHETTAAELAWAFQLLAHHTSARSRLIREIAQENSRAYLTATVREVLRHRPVFPFTIPREVRRPIEIDGRLYNQPSSLLGCIYLLHHNSELYTEPYLFRPERFLEEPPNPQTWLPWGGGRRRCPGHDLATLEMEIILRRGTVQLKANPRDHSGRAETRASTLARPNAHPTLRCARDHPPASAAVIAVYGQPHASPRGTGVIQNTPF